MTPEYWPDATRALSHRDPVMKRLIGQYKGEALSTRGDIFYTLARSITGQQISVKAADSVWKRVDAATGATAEGIAALTDEELRACGLSAQKVAYLRHLSAHFRENPDTPERWRQLEDEALIAKLSALRGIGRWTAEMALIFHYQRPDVFPLADLGLLKAVYLHYNAGEKMEKQSVITLSERWRPYRTVATWYLWRALDPVPVEY